MKKVLLILVVFSIMVFLYLHQPPILKTGKAIVTANEHLNNLPDEYDSQITAFELKDIPEENITAALYRMDGFWNGIFNKSEWQVTIRSGDTEVWIVLDAHNGEIIKMSGALN